MVRVDYRIQPLVAKYGVRRNFRVLFPNGERADLTSADIIDDTVELSESVCSETVFRFGCIERSMISFECMGVENIQGCQIRAGLEIDISSLDPAVIPYIQDSIARGWDDGEIVLEEDSDLGWGYYRIPYGLFWVESCPRDHGNRKRRKVTAYSADINKASPVERVRLATYAPGYDTFQAKPYHLAAVNAGWLTPDLFTAWNFRRDTGSNYNYYRWSDIQAAASTEIKSFSVTEGGHTYEVTIAAKYAVMDYEGRMSGSNTCELGQINLSGFDTDAAWYDFQKFFADNGVSEPAVAAHTRLPRTYLQPHLTYDKLDQYGGSKYDHAPIYWLPDYGCPFYMQVYRTQSLHANGAVRLMWDMTVAFAIDGVTQESKSYFPASAVEASIYQIYAVGYNFGGQSSLYYKATDKYEANNVAYYSFVDSYKSTAVLSPYLELHARHIRVDRKGLPQIIRLNNSSPTAIPAEKIESIFWEDSQISPIGEVDWRRRRSTVDDPDATITGTDFVGNGGRSIYKMLNNAYLLAENYNSSPIPGYFFPYLSQSEFTPYEAVIHDLPWMQPGDAIELATADEDTPTLTSFILTQKIRGVKSLRQEITASGGATFFENNAMVDGVAAIYGDQNASL